MKKIKGKIAIWWYVFLVILNAFCIWVIISKDTTLGILGGSVVMGAFDVLFLPTIFHNYVELGSMQLKIVFGLSHQEIPYKNITKIVETHNPLLGLAASLDRYYILHKNGSSIVSVQDKEMFKREVLLYNKKIEFVGK